MTPKDARVVGSDLILLTKNLLTRAVWVGGGYFNEKFSTYAFWSPDENLGLSTENIYIITERFSENTILFRKRGCAIGSNGE
jgi:hypothetical protein